MMPEELLENLPGVVYRRRADAEWTMLSAFGAVEELFGRPAADFFEGRAALADLVHPADRAHAARAVIHATGETAPFEAEYRIFHADGTQRWVLDRGRPVYDGDGLACHIDGVLVDVTRTRLSENALRAGEENYRTLAEQATDLVCRYSPDGVLLYASPSASSIVGYTPAALIGRSVYEFLHVDDVRSVAAAHLDVLMTGERRTVTYRFRREDGAWIWIESAIQATRDEETNALIELHASSRDITPRRAAEEALRRELEARAAAEQALARALALVEAVLDTVPEGVVATDTAGRIVRANRAFQRLFGLPVEMMATRSMPACLEHVAGATADPASYRREWLTAALSERDQHAALVALSDGRRIEQTMLVRRVDGAVVGRVWTFAEAPVAAAVSGR